MKAGKLSQDQIDRLVAIGFRWKSRRGRPKRSAPESTVNGDIKSCSSTRQKRRKVAPADNFKVRTSSILDSPDVTNEGTYEYYGELHKRALAVGLSEMEHLIGVKLDASFEII